jgi:hypothetical protein
MVCLISEPSELPTVGIIQVLENRRTPEVAQEGPSCVRRGASERKVAVGQECLVGGRARQHDDNSESESILEANWHSHPA